jgi:hypothetical protein
MAEPVEIRVTSGTSQKVEVSLFYLKVDPPPHIVGRVPSKSDQLPLILMPCPSIPFPYSHL